MVFREMRRKKQKLSEKECIDILERGSTGVLGLLGKEGYPYTVPLNYVYAHHKIYFHCAKAGHKIEAIQAYDKVSFCVIDQENVIPETLSTNYKSVVVFGRAKILETEADIKEAVEWLGLKYNPNKEVVDREIETTIKHLCAVEITIDHLSGKQNLQ